MLLKIEVYIETFHFYYLFIFACVCLAVSVYLDSKPQIYKPFLDPLHIYQNLKHHTSRFKNYPSLYHYVTTNLKSFPLTFYKTPWLFNGHLQTAYSSAFKAIKLKYDRELCVMDDKGTVSLDWYPSRPDTDHSDTPIIFILHGINGGKCLWNFVTLGSHECYIRSIIADIYDQYKWTCVVMNNRGCAETPVTSPRLYNAADVSDIKEVLIRIHGHYQDAPIFGIGFSLGANLLMNYLGTESKNPLVCAVSVSNPYDLLCLDRAFSRSFLGRFVYSRIMAALLKKNVIK
jgi:predicted alpha/beta-fold hydrolase